MSRSIPQMEPLLAEEDRRAASDYLGSGGWITEFDRTRAFEKELARYTGARSCVTTPNGTLALFLALAACGVGAGDDVIVPDLTMAASASAVRLAGAQVVFADVEPDTLCLDLAAVERLITPRTRAVMVVALNGRAPRNLAAFVARCRSRGIRVIEDAAQALGSFHAGQHLGTFGDCGCFSFSSQKILSTGQGGAVITNDEGLAERMRLLKDFGRREGGSDNYLEVGWNFKFTDLQAVIGLSQLRRLPALVERKRAMFAAYRRELAGIQGVVVLDTDLASTTPWFMDVLVADGHRDDLMQSLSGQGIGSRPMYPALHETRAFAQPAKFPVATNIARRGLWLPSSLRVTEQDVEYICSTVRRHFTSVPA